MGIEDSRRAVLERAYRRLWDPRERDLFMVRMLALGVMGEDRARRAREALRRLGEDPPDLAGEETPGGSG